MSSMTTTLTPVQGPAGGPPLRLAGTTISYWDTLREVDRLASINSNKFRKLGRKTGWFPAGLVLQKWTEEVYPTITKILNDAGNYERIFGKHNKEVTRPCWLYMVGQGQQWMTARPTIVAICSKTRIAQRICDLLQNMPSMRTWNLGFEYMHHKEKLVLVTGNGGSNAASNISGNLCGLQVLASTYPASLSAKWKQTTIGGTLKINQEYYCLSVAHAFHLDASVAGNDDSESSLDSDDGSEQSEDFYSASEPKSSISVIACRPSVVESVDLGLYLDYGPVSTNARALGGKSGQTQISADPIRVIGSGRARSWATSKLRPLLLCAELDWVLVRVTDPQFFGSNLVQSPSGKLLSPQRVSSTPPGGQVLVAAGVSGVFESHCQGIVGGLSLPGSFRMIDVWTIESVCLPGDCGSWVIDPVSGNIYGMIVATAPEVQESYMIPAYQVYDSIKSRLPAATTVGFPATNDNGVVRTMSVLTHPRGSSVPSTKAVDRSKVGKSQIQEKTVPTTHRIHSFLELYHFHKRGEDWNVAGRRMIRSAQTELKKKANGKAQTPGKVLEQMNAMNTLRRKQIDQLVEQRTGFWEKLQRSSLLEKEQREAVASWDRQQVSARITMIETKTSQEKKYNNTKVVEVLSFDVIISISGPPILFTIFDGSHWLPDEICNLRLPVPGGNLGTALSEPQSRSLVHGISQAQDKPLVPRGSEGQIDDPFAEKELFSRDGKPADLRTSGLASSISTKGKLTAAAYGTRRKKGLDDVADEPSRSKVDSTAREVDHHVSRYLEDSRLAEDTRKALELSIVSAHNQLDGGTEQNESADASNRKGGKMVVYDKDSGYDVLKQRAKPKRSTSATRYDSDDSWDTESDAERSRIRPKSSHRRPDREERAEPPGPVIVYAPPRRTSSRRYYHEPPPRRRRSPTYDGGVGIRDSSRRNDSVPILHPTSRHRDRRGASPGPRFYWH